MKKLLILMAITFCMGYMAGAGDYTKQEQPITEVVIKNEKEWFFPVDCQDTITFGMSTRLTNSQRVDQYAERAQRCFDTLDQKAPEIVQELPEDTVEQQFIPQEVDEPTDEEIDNAFEDCLDDDWSEIYCDDNYEDWLD